MTDSCRRPTSEWIARSSCFRPGRLTAAGQPGPHIKAFVDNLIPVPPFSARGYQGDWASGL
ncbi:MAG: hypothetical protein ACT6RN_12055 [Agrobacterium sp.]|uniref:hypothetical protein n=1 Tax=Agrobacterium sp. TaxID=361 RepID=UPI0040378C36